MKIDYNKICLLLIISISFASYDTIVYKNAYNLFISIVLALGFFICFIRFQINSKMFINLLKSNIIVVFLGVSMMISTMLSSLFVGLLTWMDLITTISTILSLIIFFVFLPLYYLKYKDELFKYIIILISFASIIAIVMQTTGYTFGHTQKNVYRMSSIIFDANYFGSMCSIAILLSLIILKKKSLQVVTIILNGIALYYSNSRGATLALAFAILFYYTFVYKFSIKKFFIVFITCIVGFISFEYLEANNYFRLNQGLNSRDFLWEIAGDLLSKNPLTGYGKSSIDTLLRSNGATNGSTHNFLLDFAISYGLISLFFYVCIIFQTSFRGFVSKNKDFLLIFIFLIINSNSINMSIGGLGFNSLIFTIVAGILNLKTNDVGEMKTIENQKKTYLL